MPNLIPHGANTLTATNAPAPGPATLTLAADTPYGIAILHPAPPGGGPNKLRPISGSVTGLSKAQVKQYRVVVYAYTDQWYLQPTTISYYANISAKLAWKTKTHLGNQYGALLVKKGYLAAPKLSALPSPDGVMILATCECNAATR